MTETLGYPTYQITKGDWVVRDVVRVDEEKGKIYFSANGVNKDEGPLQHPFYSINIDGTGMTDLTPEKGYHSATFSPKWIILWMLSHRPHRLLSLR